MNSISTKTLLEPFTKPQIIFTKKKISLNSNCALWIQLEQKLIPHYLHSPAVQNLSGCLAFMSPSQQMEAGQLPADNVPCYMEVSLAKEMNF